LIEPVGGGPPQVVAYVIAWALFEIPFMPARFVWFRAAAAALSMATGKP
jgi:hypothetical protein